MKTTSLLMKTPLVEASLDGRKTMTRRTKGLAYINQTPDEWELGTPEQWATRLAENSCFGRRITSDDIQEKASLLREKGWLFFRNTETGRMVSPRCPYGAIGDLIYIKEKYKFWNWTEDGEPQIMYSDGETRWVDYPEEQAERVVNIWAALSDAENFGLHGAARDIRWRSPLHMFRWASRLTLRIKSVRVERLQDISEEEAESEGIEIFNEDGNLYYSGWMEGQESWFSYPWKWHCNDPISAFCELWDGINFDRAYGWAKNPWVWVIEYDPINASVEQVLREAA